MSQREFEEMVKLIRNVEIGSGSYVKKFRAHRVKENINLARKSIVANSIAKGYLYKFKPNNEKTRTGISPVYWDSLIEKIKKNYKKINKLKNEKINFCVVTGSRAYGLLYWSCCVTKRNKKFNLQIIG